MSKFDHIDTRTYGPGRRRKMKRFKMNEISVVDSPAQEGATARIMKRRMGDMDLMDLRQHALDLAKRRALASDEGMERDELRTRGGGSRPVSTGRGALDLEDIENPAEERMRRGHRRVGKEDEEEDEDEILARFRRGGYDEDDEFAMADDEEDDEEDVRFTRGDVDDVLAGEEEEFEFDQEAETDDEKIRRLLSEKAMDEDEEEDPDEEEIKARKAAELQEEVDEELNANSSRPITRVGRVAAKLMQRDPRLGKRLALIKAQGQLAARGGFYKQLATGGARPPPPLMGREAEIRRRAIDAGVRKVQAAMPNTPYPVALRKVKRAYGFR